MIARRLFFLILFSSSAVMAQDTLSYRLPEVEVSTIRFPLSGNEQRTDTTTANLLTARTASEILSREPGVFIRNYGPGNISTLSIRGLSAVHTPVLWYDLPMNSPMLGLSDLSLLPTFLTGGMSIQYGGIAPLNGSGAISGCIHLGDMESKPEGCHIGLLTTVGSFGERQAGIELEMNQKGISNRTRLYSSSSRNDFPYTSPDGIRLNQIHADMSQLGFTHDFVLQTNNDRLESHLWYMESERDLPPHMLSGSSTQEQADGSLRWITSWNHTGTRSQIRVLGGFSRERLRFIDPSVRLDDLSRSLNTIAAVEGSYRLHPAVRLEGQMAVQHADATSDGYYSGKTEQQQLNLTGKAVTVKKDLTMVLAVRYGFAGEKTLPLLPSINTRWQPNRVVSFHGEGSRVYRLPTLNDLYWSIGGNPDLRPENGWSASSGFTIQDAYGEIAWSIRSSLFYISLTDALTWLPDDQAYYRAMNMHTLVSKGLESSMNITWTKPAWTISATWNPTLVSSVITNTDPVFEHLTSRQLPYTPRLAHKGVVEVVHRDISIRYLFQYNGYRFTTEDHGYFLPPYHVSDLLMSWRNKNRKTPLTLTFAVKNLFEEEYQVMAWRAMPGRSFQLGMLLKLTEAVQ